MVKSSTCYQFVTWTPLAAAVGFSTFAILHSIYTPSTALFPKVVLYYLLPLATFFFLGVLLESFILTCPLFRRKNCYNSEKSKLLQFAHKVPIIYSQHYNISAFGLENIHPFDSRKYGRVVGHLTSCNVIQEEQILEPEPIPFTDLIKYHSLFYILSLNYSIKLCSVLEVPLFFLPASFLRWRVLLPMLYQAGGTVLAAEVAMKKGWSINLGGGFHHASYSNCSGFCVFADITMGIKELRGKFPLVQRVMIIDLDAHQGNGHARDFADDINTFIFDAYNPTVFPNDIEAKRSINATMLTFKKIDDYEYLKKLEVQLSSAIQSFAPEFILYNAGTDCLIDDPLGNMSLSEDTIIKRDEFVFNLALNSNPSIPITMVLSGGYQMSNAALIAKSITNLDEKFSLMTR